MKGCSAKQFSDQMVCSTCELTWDVNDPEPPVCNPLRVLEVGRAAIRQIRASLEGETHVESLGTRCVHECLQCGAAGEAPVVRRVHDEDLVAVPPGCRMCGSNEITVRVEVKPNEDAS